MSVLALWLGNTLWGWSGWVLTLSLLVGIGLLVTGGIALRRRTVMVPLVRVKRRGLS